MPTGTTGNRNNPLPFVTVSNVAEVSILANLTAAPGTIAPEGSASVPSTVPVCGLAGLANNSKKQKTKVQTLKRDIGFSSDQFGLSRTLTTTQHSEVISWHTIARHRRGVSRRD